MPPTPIDAVRQGPGRRLDDSTVRRFVRDWKIISVILTMAGSLLVYIHAQDTATIRRAIEHQEKQDAVIAQLVTANALTEQRMNRLEKQQEERFDQILDALKWLKETSKGKGR